MHRLALALGRTVAELGVTMTSSELSDWIDYYKIEPWGAWRDNYHAALIASMHAKEGTRLSEFFYEPPAEPVLDKDGRARKSDIESILGLI